MHLPCSWNHYTYGMLCRLDSVWTFLHMPMSMHSLGISVCTAPASDQSESCGTSPHGPIPHRWRNGLQMAAKRRLELLCQPSRARTPRLLPHTSELQRLPTRNDGWSWRASSRVWGEAQAMAQAGGKESERVGGLEQTIRWIQEAVRKLAQGARVKAPAEHKDWSQTAFPTKRCRQSGTMWNRFAISQNQSRLTRWRVPAKSSM